MNNLEARARALARHVLTNGVGNPAWHQRHLDDGCPPDQMPRLLTPVEIEEEIERDWELYAEIICDPKHADRDFGASVAEAIPDAKTASLINAAPDMLEALKAVVSVADRKTVEFDKAHVAIAKAEGRSPVPHKREESKNIFGYFDSADQTKPAFDPGLDVMCPFCLKKLTLPVRTTSLWADGDDRSFFYRAHRDCADAATPEQETQIEGSLIDSRAALIPNERKK